LRKLDFRKLWAALSISLFGSQITTLALPLLAVLVLGASPLDMGILAASGQAPFLIMSLPVGVWVDRLPRRPILIGTDVASAILLLSVPLALPFGGPWFAQLCLVAFGLGALNVASEVAHYAYVPSLVGRDDLTAYNSKLQMSHSVANAAGPGVGGFLVQLVSAPVAILADAASFVVSAALVAAIRRPEHRERALASAPLRESIAVGLRALLGHRYLRPIIAASSVISLFESAFNAIFVLYAARELGLNPGEIGLVFGAGGIGAVVGAAMADRIAKRVGLGRSLILGWGLSGLVFVIVPSVAGEPLAVVVGLGVINALGQLVGAVANIQQWSLRQAVTPDELAGRVTATHRFIVYGAGAIGAIVGGAAAIAIGLRAALLGSGLGMILGTLVAVLSPLRGLRRMPTLEEEPVMVDRARPAPARASVPRRRRSPRSSS
jgi:MFS family permease